MKPYIFICSRLKGRTPKEKAKFAERARYLCRKVMLLGGIPMAPHVYFTEFLDDANPEERQMGIELGHEWMRSCDALLYDATLGESEGMQADWRNWSGKFFRIDTLEEEEFEFHEIKKWIDIKARTALAKPKRFNS
jgi:hypothetical protein